MTNTSDVSDNLRKRAQIRRKAKSRKSVEEGKPDRLANQLDEAADEIDKLVTRCAELRGLLKENDVELIALGVKFGEQNQALRDENAALKAAARALLDDAKRVGYPRSRHYSHFVGYDEKKKALEALLI
jgi:chromosome segregation ATPase